ncbi:MAG: SUMF1/EgtB/PvdO family nonheme iron enzyme [Chloroflexi bacterium]|nr:SUMF1/EgtB/PvdO family nonheme iron enzyme [Chloroflexota bacterium]
MKTSMKHIGKGLCIILLCFLVGCNLDFGQPATGTPEIVETDVPAIQNQELDIDIPQPEAGTAILWTDNSFVVYVPPGDFIMGQDKAEPSDHNPAHTITLDGFWIHQTEVTNRMYAQCVALGVCTPPAVENGVPYWFSLASYASDPVVGVDWYQAETYCEWIEGRLPTEAEWEKAARGDEGDPYPWGEDEPTCNLLNFEGCFDPDGPQHVRSYLLGASFYELADTAGNVYEWVLDRYDAEYYAQSPTSNPTGPSTGDTRVVRGSSYLTPLEELLIYLRIDLKPEKHTADLGFRCILTGETIIDPPPPACEVQAMYIPPLDQPTPVVSESPDPIVNAFCMVSQDGTDYGVVNLDFGEPVEEIDYFITSSIGVPIVNHDPAFPDILTITNVPLDTTFELTICPNLPAVLLPPTTPECPPGYYYDNHDDLCYFDHEPGDVFMCSGDAIAIPGFGCLPKPICGICPVGYFPSEYEGMDVCVPVGIPDLYTLVDCLEGMEYDPENACCQLPPDSYEPTCPPGYIFDPGCSICMPGYEEDTCTTLTVYIPPCEEPTQLVCTNPGQYSSKSSCEAANCRWFEPSVSAPYCTYP